MREILNTMYVCCINAFSQHPMSGRCLPSVQRFISCFLLLLSPKAQGYVSPLTYIRSLKTILERNTVDDAVLARFSALLNIRHIR